MERRPLIGYRAAGAGWRHRLAIVEEAPGRQMWSCTRRERNQRGLSLIELMVGLAIVGLLVSVAFAGFGALARRGQLTDGANNLVMAVAVARSEASRRGGGIRLEAVDGSDDANEWGPGFRVEDAAGTELRRFPAVAGVLTLNGPDDVEAVTFNSRGTPDAAITFDLCEPGVRGVRVRVSATGRTDTDDLVAADCPDA
jgi:type IV fimbrial biogenesis protein FimT